MYELAYHITPDFEEAAIGAKTQDIESLVAQAGGSVIASRTPKKIHLSYPISRKHYAYFGTIDFNAEAEAIDGLHAQFKLQDGVLRFLMIKKPEQQKLRTLGDPRIRRGRMQVAPTHKTPETEAVKPKQEEQVIEKELEQVLGKL